MDSDDLSLQKIPCYDWIFELLLASDAPLMIDSSLYKELMVTDGSPDEKIISRVWGGE